MQSASPFACPWQVRSCLQRSRQQPPRCMLTLATAPSWQQLAALPTLPAAHACSLPAAHPPFHSGIISLPAVVDTDTGEASDKRDFHTTGPAPSASKTGSASGNIGGGSGKGAPGSGTGATGTTGSGEGQGSGWAWPGRAEQGRARAQSIAIAGPSTFTPRPLPTTQPLRPAAPPWLPATAGASSALLDVPDGPDPGTSPDGVDAAEVIAGVTDVPVYVEGVP